MEKELTYVIDFNFICGHVYPQERVINVDTGLTKDELLKSDSSSVLRVQSLTFRYDDEKVDTEDVVAYARVSVYDSASKFMKELKKSANEYIKKWDSYKSDRHVHFNISGDNLLEYNKAAYTKNKVFLSYNTLTGKDNL